MRPQVGIPCGSLLRCAPRRLASSSLRATPVGSSGTSSKAAKKRLRDSEPLRGPGQNLPKAVPLPDAAQPRSGQSDDPELRTPSRSTKPARPSIDFVTGESGPSLDRMAFFSDGLSESERGSVGFAEEVPGLEAGRVVEVRRTGFAAIGLILASITVGLKERLLLLRSTGEIWPVGLNDVQFVMPQSLVPADLVDKVWHPDLLTMWANGEDIGLGADENGNEAQLIGTDKARELMSARRKVAALLRRVQRETERMQSRLLGGTLTSGRGGGIEALWDAFVPDDPNLRGSITAAQAAEYLLNNDNTEGSSKHVTVRPHTLPAFAAHQLLMQRSDLFLADDLMMYETGTFLVRSQADRRRLREVERIVQTSDPALVAFVDKAKRVAELLKADKVDRAALPSWTNTDLDLLHVLALALAERRSTQFLHAESLAAGIAKWFDLGADGKVDLNMLASLLHDVGILPAFDSSLTSKLNDSAARAGAMGGFVAPASFGPADDPTPADAALDPLRSDMSHRVYVIDDAMARELDDGVAIEDAGNGQYWVHVYVADPTRYVERDGPISTAASYMGTSYYLPEGSVPMLPPTLGGGRLSLGAGSDGRGQAVMVFSARVDKEGNILDHKIGMGFSKNAVVTTYDSVNKALNIGVARRNHPFGSLAHDQVAAPAPDKHTSLNAEHAAELQTLLDLSVALRAKRYATAGFEWTLPSSSLEILNTPRVPSNIFDRAALPSSPEVWNPRTNDEIQYAFSVSEGTTYTSSQTMVAEYMVLANRVAAWFCGERGIAAAFRGSGPFMNTSRTPASLTVDKLLGLREPGTGFIDAYVADRAHILFSRTETRTRPIPHWIMGLNAPGDAYVRATSPLRRYDDMLAHWQIKAALASDAGVSGGERLLDHDAMLPLVKRADYGQRRDRAAQRTAESYWRAGLFRQRATGPLPPGYLFNADDTPVDLAGPLQARVKGLPVCAAGAWRLPIVVPALGSPADLQLPSRDVADKFNVGDDVSVVLDHIEQWPIPKTNFQLAS